MNEQTNEEIFTETEGEGDSVEASPEVTAQVGVSEEVFIQRMDSAENLMVGILVCTALVVGAVMATLVMRYFHVH